jgi:hypothetical protein
VENRNVGWRVSDTSKKKMPFWPRNTLSKPPQARMFSSSDRCRDPRFQDLLRRLGLPWIAVVLDFRTMGLFK